MKEHTIEYEVTRNQLAAGSKYKGKVLHQQVMTNGRIVEEMVKRNSTVTRQEALAVIDLYEQIVKEELHRGNTVSTGIFRADLSMSGGFETYDEKINYKKHKAKVVIRPAIHLNRDVCKGVRFNKSRKRKINFFISYITDMFSRRADDVITAGAPVSIKGKGLKSYQHKNEYELFLEAPGKKRVDLKIISASYETVTALVPHDTAPGQYALKLVHRYGRVEREFSRLDVKVETN